MYQWQFAIIVMQQVTIRGNLVKGTWDFFVLFGEGREVLKFSSESIAFILIFFFVPFLQLPVTL